MKTLLLPLIACACLGFAPAPLFAQDDEEAPQDAEQEEESVEEALERQLKTQNVTLNFDATPIDEAFNFLRDITGLNILVYPGVDAEAEVHLRLKDISLDNALKLILASAGEGVDFQVWAGAVVVKPAKVELGEAPEPGDSAVGKVLATRRVTLNFPGTPFEEVIAFLQDVTGLNVVLEAKAREKGDALAVSLRVRDLDLARALTLSTHPYGLTWKVENDAVVISVKD
jgi:type II secretory pathway component GspD/PulD (secretin)